MPPSLKSFQWNPILRIFARVKKEWHYWAPPFSKTAFSCSCPGCSYPVFFQYLLHWLHKLFFIFPAWNILLLMFSFQSSFLFLNFQFQFHILQENAPCLPREAWMLLCFLSQSIIYFPFCYTTCVIISAHSNFIKVVGSVSVGSMFVLFAALFLGSTIILGSN